eukprot:m51a1_g13027 hypothetical protein (543) ;mRNA; f:3-2327
MEAECMGEDDVVLVNATRSASARSFRVAVVSVDHPRLGARVPLAALMDAWGCIEGVMADMGTGSVELSLRGVVVNRSAVPRCTATLYFDDGTQQHSEVHMYRHRVLSSSAVHWVACLRADLAARFFGPPVGSASRNMRIAASCLDRTDGQVTNATWGTFVLGTCGDSDFGECIQSSVTNRACAYCGSQCVPYPVGPNETLPATCTRCGDGVVSKGEQCEAPQRYCYAATCRCAAGSEPTSDHQCAARAIHMDVKLREQRTVPLGEMAEELERCLDSALGGAPVTRSVWLNPDESDRGLSEASVLLGPRPGAPLNASTPFGLLRAASQELSRCANRSFDFAASHSFWSESVGCGDGVVSGEEECDSSDYCSLYCKCAWESLNIGGLCFPRTAFLIVDMRPAKRLVDDSLVEHLVEQLAAQCYATGEVRLANLTLNTELPAVLRVSLVSAQPQPFPGARGPITILSQQMDSNWRCVSEVLAAQGMANATVQYSDQPFINPWFPEPWSPRPSPPSPLSSARSGVEHSSTPVLMDMAVVALALALK